MGLMSKCGCSLVLLVAWMSAPVPEAVAEDSFAVVRIANATDNLTIQYYFKWSDKSQQYTIKPRSHVYHYYRHDLENQNSSPVPEVEFAPRIGAAKKWYRLRASDSSRSDSGGTTYVFDSRIDGRGGVRTDLLSLEMFLDRSCELVATLLAERQYNKAVERCDRALEVDPTDAPTRNYRGRASYLLKTYDSAIGDFTKAIELGPDQAIYRSNRGYSYLGLEQYQKALADFEAAIGLDPELKNPERGIAIARSQLAATRATKKEPSREQVTPSPVVQETRLDTSGPSRPRDRVPREFEPYITPDAYVALIKFRLGSKVDADENYRLQVAYDKAYEEGRYIDAQEANYIRAIEREPVAALWKMLTGPGDNNYYLPKFTPVEERLDGLKRPLVGKGSDKMVYVKSDDDLAGLRIAVRRPPQERGDGGLETAAIIPFRWVSGSGVVPLDPPDNLRVLIQLKKEGEHAMLGMSFSLRPGGDGTWDLRPEIYTSPKFGDDRFKAASSTVVSPRGCMDCHALGFNIKATKFVGPARGGEAEFAAAIKQMPGFEGFLTDARLKGASPVEVEEAAAIIARPDTHLLTWQSLRIAVVKLWNAIYYANQPYLDDADSRFVEYHDKYGSAWLETGDFDQALRHFDKAIRRGSDVAALYLKRGWIYLRQQRYADAIQDLDQSLRLDPKLTFAYATRSAVHGKSGRLDLAMRDAEDAVRLGPKVAAAFFSRAEIDLLAGDYRRSLADADVAIRLQPLLVAAHNLRAKILATSPVSDLRDGAGAIRSATRACELSGWRSREVLDTLAAAYAEASNFAEAAKWQQKALDDPDLAGNVNADETKAARDRLELYRKNLPFRDTPRPQSSSRPG
jgi:tetratricopeptide (TPR) repeat protein